MRRAAAAASEATAERVARDRRATGEAESRRQEGVAARTRAAAKERAEPEASESPRRATDDRAGKEAAAASAATAREAERAEAARVEAAEQADAGERRRVVRAAEGARGAAVVEEQARLLALAHRQREASQVAHRREAQAWARENMDRLASAAREASGRRPRGGRSAPGVGGARYASGGGPTGTRGASQPNRGYPTTGGPSAARGRTASPPGAATEGEKTTPRGSANESGGTAQLAGPLLRGLDLPGSLVAASRRTWRVASGRSARRGRPVRRTGPGGGVSPVLPVVGVRGGVRPPLGSHPRAGGVLRAGPRRAGRQGGPPVHTCRGGGVWLATSSGALFLRGCSGIVTYACCGTCTGPRG